MGWRETELGACESLDKLLASATTMMSELKGQGYSIHHVAGPISADGDEYILRNLAELASQRDRVAKRLGNRAIVITSPLIFTEIVYRRLGIFEMPREEREATLRQFWDDLIAAGHLDGIYFAPGYERSPGSQAEHEAAERHSVPISYLTHTEHA